MKAKKPKGKRKRTKRDFVPPTIPIEPRSRSPVYDMHSYWAKKPYTVTDFYIRHFTETGDIVLDPFAGSGVTNIEAVRLGRKTVAVDINPLSTFIIDAATAPVQPAKLKDALRKIAKDVQSRVESLYVVPCPNCSRDAIADYFVWSDDKLDEVRYDCPNCRTSGSAKTVRLDDLITVKDADLPDDIPDVPMVHNSRINVQ